MKVRASAKKICKDCKLSAAKAVSMLFVRILNISKDKVNF